MPLNPTRSNLLSVINLIVILVLMFLVSLDFPASLRFN